MGPSGLLPGPGPGEGQEEAARQRLWQLCCSEDVAAALQRASPGLLREGADVHSVPAEQLAALCEELARVRRQDELLPARPRALVRAMQQLHLARSAKDPSLHLSVETADEEALRQLAERTAELVPALAAMRAGAVDHAIFEHLADRIHTYKQIIIYIYIYIYREKYIYRYINKYIYNIYIYI